MARINLCSMIFIGLLLSLSFAYAQGNQSTDVLTSMKDTLDETNAKVSALRDEMFSITEKTDMMQMAIIVILVLVIGLFAFMAMIAMSTGKRLKQMNGKIEGIEKTLNDAIEAQASKAKAPPPQQPPRYPMRPPMYFPPPANKQVQPHKKVEVRPALQRPVRSAEKPREMTVSEIREKRRPFESKRRTAIEDLKSEMKGPKARIPKPHEL